MAAMDKELWAELKPLLDQVLELPLEQRAPWIEALRAEKPTLAHELETLLEVDAAATGALWGDTRLDQVQDMAQALAELAARASNSEPFVYLPRASEKEERGRAANANAKLEIKAAG